MRFNPTDVGWRLGTSRIPHGVPLWQPWDRTAGAIGPQGSGKTLDILTPALLQAPGAALVTLTKPDDLFLTFTARSRIGPCLVLDPFGTAPGLPQLVWDPIGGCIDATTAERRAKAFCAGTITRTGNNHNESAAQFYAAEAAKVIQCYLHAAALAGYNLNDILTWVANPKHTTLPTEILRNHPTAEPNWHGLLNGAINNPDDRTAGNTKTTIEQALALFTTRDRRNRCIPTHNQPATNLEQFIQQRGTLYLLGREDPYVNASPLMTAVAEDFLDTALQLAYQSPHGRLCPPILACLDELPSTAPLPTLPTRMANERALGISILWASQTRAQLEHAYGQQAKTILGLTNTLILFGGSKDQAFNKELSDLLGTRRINRHTQHQSGRSHNSHSEDTPVIRPEQLRTLPPRTSLVIAENGRPMLAKLHRSISGKRGRTLLAEQVQLRETTRAQSVPTTVGREDRTAEARAQALQLGLLSGDGRNP